MRFNKYWKDESIDIEEFKICSRCGIMIPEIWMTVNSTLHLEPVCRYCEVRILEQTYQTKYDSIRMETL